VLRFLRFSTGDVAEGRRARLRGWPREGPEFGRKPAFHCEPEIGFAAPYRGPVEGTLSEIMGGVRSMMTYIGAAHLKEVSKRTTFVRVTAQTNDVFGS